MLRGICGQRLVEVFIHRVDMCCTPTSVMPLQVLLCVGCVLCMRSMLPPVRVLLLLRVLRMRKGVSMMIMVMVLMHLPFCQCCIQHHHGGFLLCARRIAACYLLLLLLKASHQAFLLMWCLSLRFCLLLLLLHMRVLQIRMLRCRCC